MRTMMLAAPVLACSVLFAAPAAAAYPTNGTLEVPNDIKAGDYWGSAAGSSGGSVRLCADSACQPGKGFIDSVFVTKTGRHLVHIPGNTKFVHVNGVKLVKK